MSYPAFCLTKVLLPSPVGHVLKALSSPSRASRKLDPFGSVRQTFPASKRISIANLIGLLNEWLAESEIWLPSVTTISGSVSQHLTYGMDAFHSWKLWHRKSCGCYCCCCFITVDNNFSKLRVLFLFEYNSITRPSYHIWFLNLKIDCKNSSGLKTRFFLAGAPPPRN